MPTRMDCQEFRLAHLDFCDGTLPEAVEEAARSHLDACASCAHFDCLVRRGSLIVRNLPPVALRSGAHARVMARVSAAAAQRQRGRETILTLAATAASITIIAAVLTFGSARSDPPPVLDAQSRTAPATPPALLLPRAAAMRRDFIFAEGDPEPSIVSVGAPVRVRFADATLPPFLLSR